jgi:diaminopimelate decarboxylase
VLRDPSAPLLSQKQEVDKFVVVGHCCESGDLFSCKPGDPEALDVRFYYSD